MNDSIASKNAAWSLIEASIGGNGGQRSQAFRQLLYASLYRAQAAKGFELANLAVGGDWLAMLVRPKPGATLRSVVGQVRAALAQANRRLVFPGELAPLAFRVRPVRSAAEYLDILRSYDGGEPAQWSWCRRFEVKPGP